MRVPTTTAPGPVATSRSGTRQQGPVGAESNRNWTNNLGPSTTSRLKVLSSSKNGLIGRAVTYQMKSSGRREFARGTYGRRVWAANSAWNVLPYTVTCGPKKCLA